MMQRCSSSHGNVMGACTCGSLHSQSNSSCMLFSMANHKPYDYDESSATYYYYTPSSTSVDCTLSLGTPSTRFTEEEERRNRHDQRRSGNSVSNFCWDLLQPKNSSYSEFHGKPSRGTNCGNSNSDPLVTRRCANCDTTSTPLWRNGPRGPKSLCNACGIRFKKEERRASAAGTTTANNAASSGANIMEFSNQNSTWYSHAQNQKMPCLSPTMGDDQFHFVSDSDRDPDSGISFLSWRLNVTDRPSLVHDFTR